MPLHRCRPPCGMALFAAVAFLASLLALPAARAGTIVKDSYRSALLGREVAFQVYLPSGYETGKDAYPVTYLLHGAEGDESQWPQLGVLHTFDALQRRAEIRPTIAVMPSFGPYSWWIDGAQAPAQTAFMTELLPLVEKRYRIAGQRHARSVAGLSMGGFGALNLALRFPATFCGAGLLSPAIYMTPPAISAAVSSPQFQRDGRFDPALWQAQSWTHLLDAYAAQPQRVALWIMSGDHDSLGLALESAQLYWRLHPLQKAHIELRIVDGGHEHMVWRDGLPDALRYLDRQCSKGP